MPSDPELSADYERAYKLVHHEIREMLDWPYSYENEGWGTIEDAERDEDVLVRRILKALLIDGDEDDVKPLGTARSVCGKSTPWDSDFQCVLSDGHEGPHASDNALNDGKVSRGSLTESALKDEERE